MGFFDKVKQTFNVGGVDVDIEVPSSVATTDPTIPVTASLTTKSPQAVKGVRARLLRTSRNSVGAGSNTPETTVDVISLLENSEAFQINPGETKIVHFDLPHNVGEILKESLPENNIVGQKIVGALQQLSAANDMLNRTSFRYDVEVIADVDGAAFDPSKKVGITFLKPGELGGSFNAHT